jgi:hypothetical protein
LSIALYTILMNSDEVDAFANECIAKLDANLSRDELYEAIVNVPFFRKLETTRLGIGIIVLLLKNSKTGTLDRVALSKTDRAQSAVEISVKKFQDIKIPLSADNNAIIQAITKDEFKIVSDWKYLFLPALTSQEARLNQAGAAIDCSVVYPLSGLHSGGAMIFSYFEPLSKLTNYHHRFMNAYSKACATALNNLR